LPPKNKPFYAVKNFSSGGIFLVTLFFAVEKRVTGSKGFESKTIMDDGAKRAFEFQLKKRINSGARSACLGGKAVTLKSQKPSGANHVPCMQSTINT
jgi:hypothetical protein